MNKPNIDVSELRGFRLVAENSTLAVRAGAKVGISKIPLQPGPLEPIGPVDPR